MSNQSANLKQAIDECRQENRDAIQKIDTFLTRQQNNFKKFSEELGSKNISKDTLIKRLEEVHADNPILFGVSVCYEPYAFSKIQKLFGPFLTKNNGESKLMYVNDIYDYTDRTVDGTAWYAKPVDSGKAMWIEPYYGKASQAIVVDYSVPFFRNVDGKKTVAGVITATYTVDSIRKLIGSLNLGYNGYGFIMSKNGTLISHPLKKLATGRVTLMEVARKNKDDNLLRMAEDAVAGNSGYVDHNNIVTGQESWLIYDPIKLTGWSLSSMVIKDESLKNARHPELTTSI